MTTIPLDPSPIIFPKERWLYRKTMGPKTFKIILIITMPIAILLLIPGFYFYSTSDIIVAQWSSLMLVFGGCLMVYNLVVIKCLYEGGLYSISYMHLFSDIKIGEHDLQVILTTYLNKKTWTFEFKEDGITKMFIVKEPSIRIEYIMKEPYVYCIILKDVDGNVENLLKEMKEELTMEFGLNRETTQWG